MGGWVDKWVDGCVGWWMDLNETIVTLKMAASVNKVNTVCP